jgi:hypothetical protein
MKTAKTVVQAENTTIELKYGGVKIARPVNSPKLNSVAVACSKLQAIAGGRGTDKLTGFGHLCNCKGGIIDAVIFSGNVHSLESFVSTLNNSGLKVVENDRAKYSNDTLRAVLAKRTVDHIMWCSNTANNQHGGFASRLQKTGLAGKRDELAGLLNELAGLLNNAYKAEYSALYRNRNKTGLK